MAASALRDFDSFFVEIERRSGRKVAFRWRPLGLRFFESVKRRTPSAVATGWTISHNVNGSLFTSATRTRETYVHEVFHLNDQARGWWSLQALGDVYRRIVARCGTAIACLKPFAPDDIIVRGRGGTYYAFMPDNGVTEYAADVAKRWVVEHHGWRAGYVALEARANDKPFTLFFFQQYVYSCLYCIRITLLMVFRRCIRKFYRLQRRCMHVQVFFA
jgi:hypothetical protein